MTLLTTAPLLAQAAEGGKPGLPPRATLRPEAGDPMTEVATLLQEVGDPMTGAATLLQLQGVGDPMTGGHTHLQVAGDLMTWGAPLSQEVTEEPLQIRIDRVTVETIRGVVAGAGAPGQGHR